MLDYDLLIFRNVIAPSHCNFEKLELKANKNYYNITQRIIIETNILNLISFMCVLLTLFLFVKELLYRD